MKKIKNYLLKTILFISFSLALFSCTKDDNPSLDDNSMLDSENVFTAKIDGEDFIASNIFATQLSASKVILITVENSSLEQIQLMIPGNVVKGTYNFGDFSFGSLIGGSYSPLNTEDYFETFKTINGGTLTITEFNESSKTIKGTFHTETYSSTDADAETSITEGTFNIVYINL